MVPTIGRQRQVDLFENKINLIDLHSKLQDSQAHSEMRPCLGKKKKSKKNPYDRHIIKDRTAMNTESISYSMTADHFPNLQKETDRGMLCQEVKHVT